MKIFRTDSDESLTEKIPQIQEEIQRNTGFKLSPAVCPVDGSTRLLTGYKNSYYTSGDNEKTPIILISISYDLVFSLFYDLALHIFNQENNDPCVRIGFRASHKIHHGQKPRIKYCGKTDLVVFLSVLCEFEDLILNDGCLSVSIISRRLGIELQLDDHKSIVVFYDDPEDIEGVINFLRDRRIRELSFMSTAVDVEHIHNSSTELEDRFAELTSRLADD